VVRPRHRAQRRQMRDAEVAGVAPSSRTERVAVTAEIRQEQCSEKCRED